MQRHRKRFQCLYREPLVLAAFLCLPFLACEASGRKPSAPESSAAAAPGVKDRVSLIPFVQKYGYALSANDGKELVLKSNANSLHFYHGSRKLDIGGVRVLMNAGAAGSPSYWLLHEVDAAKTLRPLLYPSAHLQGRGAQVVLLDAGHGGIDPGAVADSGLKEKDVALEITQMVKAHLEAAGYTVHLTRNGDQRVTLSDRAAMTGKVDADLFVSIHCNKAPGNQTAHGIETFILSLPGFNSTNDPAGYQPSRASSTGNRFDAENMLLGYAVHRSLILGNPVEDRGVKRARFQVLRDAHCPAALVECGFLSNPSEAGRLSVPYYRKKLALSLARGIDNYLRQVKKAVSAVQAGAAQRP